MTPTLPCSSQSKMLLSCESRALLTAVSNKQRFAFSTACFAGIFWEPAFNNQDFPLFCLSVLPRDFQTLMCIKIAKEGCVRKSTHVQFERSTCVILTVPYVGPKPCARYQQSVKNRAPGNVRAESGFRCPNMSMWIQITWYNSCQKMPISWFYLRCSQPEFLELGPENVCNKLPKGL